MFWGADGKKKKWTRETAIGQHFREWERSDLEEEGEAFQGAHESRTPEHA